MPLLVVVAVEVIVLPSEVCAPWLEWTAEAVAVARTVEVSE